MASEPPCLMVATSYPENAADWRGRFIYDMAQALGRGSDGSIAIWAPPGDLPAQVKSVLSVEDANWLRDLQARGGIAHLLRNAIPGGLLAALGLVWRLGRAYRRVNPPLVHVNWMQNALPLLGTRTPALVTVLGSDFALLKWPGMKTLLRTVWRTRPTLLVPNASWMAPELERLFGDVAAVRVVPFGVDGEWFAIQRSMSTPRRWLVVTRLTAAKVGSLFDWGRAVAGSGDRFHLFGPMQERLTLPDWIHYHGPAGPRELREKWFPTAAGLVTLSRHDEGRPQVVLEAMASGLPVIASDLPAHLDMIQHGETGYIAKGPDDLLAAVQALSDPARNLAVGLAAQKWARTHVGTWDDTAVRYHALYQELLGRRA